MFLKFLILSCINEGLRYTCLTTITFIHRAGLGFVILILFDVFLYCIAYTLDSDGFNTLIKTAMNKREVQMLKKSNTIVKMNSKIAKIFKNSHNVSGFLLTSLLCLVEKGKSHMLLRKAILQDQRTANKNKEKELKDVADLVPELKNEINKLAEELDAKDKNIEEYEKQRLMLAKLYEVGVIDEDGNLIKQRDNDNMD